MGIDIISSPLQQSQYDTIEQNTSIKDKPLKFIGNYTLYYSIGKGSMGRVKLAIDNMTGEKIAVKIVRKANQRIMNQTVQSGKSMRQINKERAREENREVRTIREANLMMLLNHPHIIKIKEMVHQDNYFYILMEYVDGIQLLEYIIQRQRLSARRTQHFARQIVSALDYLHRHSIVHRDLKIENIMVDKSGQHLKLIDFGLSNTFRPDRLLTTYCGSLYFAAPELLKSTPYYGPEVDIWSLGVVIYVMITGSVPFDDKVMSILHQKIKCGHVAYPDYLPPSCQDLLSRIFKTNPTERISMTDILHHPWLQSPLHPNPRLPLTLPLQPQVIQHMTGLESEPNLQQALLDVLTSPLYLSAHQYLDDCQARQLHTIYDDPQSIPYAYHPYISLYQLAQEKLTGQARQYSPTPSITSSLSSFVSSQDSCPQPSLLGRIQRWLRSSNLSDTGPLPITPSHSTEVVPTLFRKLSRIASRKGKRPNEAEIPSETLPERTMPVVPEGMSIATLSTRQRAHTIHVRDLKSSKINRKSSISRLSDKVNTWITRSSSLLTRRKTKE